MRQAGSDTGRPLTTQTDMTQRPHTARRPQARRKPRRRLHKGRAALLLTIIAIIVVGTMSLVSRNCTGCARRGGDFRPPVTDAIRCGQRDARKVLSTRPESMERQNALLEIRARETELRDSGYNHAADDYHNAATEFLKTHGIL